MNYIIFTIIFIIVLFLYLHIYFHIKTSDDLMVYNIDMPSKDKFEEICDLRQPVIIQYPKDELMGVMNLTHLVDNYGAFDINIRPINKDDATEVYMPLILREAVDLFLNDKDRKYYTECNEDFLRETTLLKVLQYNDTFLRPALVSSCKYDLVSGPIGLSTPLTYQLNYRNYFMVTQGSIKVKLIPPSYHRYLYSEADYLNFEFTSPINPWNVQDQYRINYEKIKSLEVELKEGMMIYIPAYWWYSFQFEKLSCVMSFKYKTYMNTVAILPQLGLHFLQKMNVKRQTFSNMGDVGGEAIGVMMGAREETREGQSGGAEVDIVQETKTESHYTFGNLKRPLQA
jgi:hypothetical protein